MLACSAGVTGPACCPAGHHCQRRAPVAAWAIRRGRGYGRANLVHSASAASLTSQRSGQRVQRACPLPRVWAGARPRQKSFPLTTWFSENHPSNGKLFARRGCPEGCYPLARAWAGVRPRKSGGRCRVANPAGSRAEPGRRRPRGQPPAGKVECRTADGVRVAAPWLNCHGLRPAHTWGLASRSVV